MEDALVQPTADYHFRPNTIVIGGSLKATARQVEAAELATAHILTQVDWDAVPAGALSFHGMASLLQFDAIGVSDAMLEDALPIVDNFTRERRIPIVASIAENQIDLMTRHLFGGSVQFLVDPSAAEQVAATTIASSLHLNQRIGDPMHDAEAARLRRLNEEVARIAETLARLTRGEVVLSERASMAVEDRKQTYGTQSDPDGAPATPLQIRQAIRSRRLRSQYFEEGLFEDPAWDMLLDLFAAELERAQVSVSSLCIAAAVAPTTALRWISKMTEGGLFVREPDPFDKRRAYMALSETARAGMRSYCMAVRRAGLSIA